MPTFRIDEDDTFNGVPSSPTEASNVVAQLSQPTSGSENIVRIDSIPPNGDTFIEYTPVGGGSSLQRLGVFPFVEGFEFEVARGGQFYVVYEPDPDFAGSAGNVDVSIFNINGASITRQQVDFDIIVDPIRDDAPTDIVLTPVPGAPVDNFPLDDGLALTEGFFGGAYFNAQQIQAGGELFERFGVVIQGTDPDIDQGITDEFLTFSVVGSSAFEVIRTDSDGTLNPSGAFSVLRLRDDAILDHETTPSVSVTLRATDSTDRTYDETFTFAVEDFDEVIDETSNIGSRYAYATSSDGNDLLVGNNENNVIFARAGADLALGLGGSDTIWGGDGDDDLVGGDGDDRLTGAAGEDTLDGGSGVDRLIGGGRADILDGGADRDIMRGQGGADSFLFEEGDFAGLNGSTADRIIDFSAAQGDVIDLSAVDAIAGGTDDAFSFIGDANFTGVAGELRYREFVAFTLAFGDTDGDGVADFAIRLDTPMALTAGDFVL